MIISYKWLKEYIDLDMSVDELARMLTLSGTEIEGVHYLGQGIEGVITGRVVDINQHPGTDKLLVCKVDMGGSTANIITGAKNLSTGDIVPVATVGSTLPDGKSIGEADFKGVLSQGMLVSAQELGLEKESTGIMVLPPDTPLGVDIKEIVGLDDWSLEFKVTPNRPDCLCMIGISRELSALTGRPLRMPVPKVVEEGTPTTDLVKVTVVDEDLCPRYMARVIQNVKVGPSPAWLQHRLRAVGIRPISNIVDVTNYVMMELNQPLHAFDMDQLAGPEIIVRRSKVGETFTTLDGVTRVLNDRMLLICDAEKPVALAGVMGGANSEVSDATTNVLLESANFNQVSIWRTSKDVKLRTEASARFEKGLDPETASLALDRAAELIAELGSGSIAPGVIDAYPVPTKPVKIQMRPDAINRLLGSKNEPAQVVAILRSLGFSVDDKYMVEVPSFRRDVSREADLVEEIGRIVGLDDLKATLPRGTTTVGKISTEMALEEKCTDYLADCGFYETLTYAFTSPKLLDRLGIPQSSSLRNQIRLSNPLTEEFSVMRVTLLGSLLEVAERNVSRRINDLALFESARIYLPGAPMPNERRVVAGLVMGVLDQSSWNTQAQEADFYHISGVVQGLLSELGVENVTLARPSDTELLYHPGRSAYVMSGGEKLGILGELHPRISEEFRLSKRAYAFELDFDDIIRLSTRQVKYSPIMKFPASRRDMAILVEETIPAALLDATIKEEAGELLEAISLFDVYTGKQVPDGMKSMAYSITYRAADRTLTDDEVNAIQLKVELALNNKLGAKMRA